MVRTRKILLVSVAKMALVRTGQGVTDIRGGMGGVYFTRDNSGLHCSSKPRRVHQRSNAQDKQRKAFIAARTFCKNEIAPDQSKNWLNRCVSYNIYRSLNGLAGQVPPVDYQIPHLQGP